MLSLSNKLSLTTQPIYRFVNKYSIDFDGADDRIITDGADTVAQPTTYSFWCKSSETGQNQGVFGHGNTNVGAFHFNAFGGNRPILYLENNYYRYWTDTSAQDDGEWHHWVVYVDTNDITNSKLYVDGVLQTVDATVSSGSTNAYTESLTIGSDRQSGGNSFLGKIDEFAVYDRELTQAEITRMFNTYYSPNRIANGNFAQEGVEEVTNGDFSQIGSELLTNGDFSSASGWSGSISVAGGQGTKTGGGLAYQSGVITSGKQYKIVVDVASLDGATNIYIGGNSSAALTVGVQTIYMTGGSSNDFFGLNNGYSTGVGSVFNSISVKEVLQDWTVSDYGGIAASASLSLDNGAVKILKTADSDWRSSFLRQTITYTNTRFYKVSFKIKDGNTTGANIYVRHNYDTSSQTIASGISLTSSFVEYTYYFQADSNSTDISFGNVSWNSAGSGEYFFVDDVTVKEVGQHWTFGTGWSIENGKAVCSSLSNNLTQDYGVIANKDYKVTVEVTDYTSGTLYVDLGGASAQTTSSLGNKTFNFTTSSTALLRFYGGAFRGSIDNIVVQELKHDATNLMLNAGDYQAASDLQNYYRMGDGILDGYPLIADQTNPSLGIELVTNGDFLLNPINANSWFESFYPGGDVLAGSTWSWDSNTYIVTGGIQQGGSNSESQLQQTVTATVGRTYKFEAYVKSTNNKARLHAYTGSPGGSYPGSSFHSGSGDWELLSICFVATGNAGSTTTVTLRLQLNAVTSGTETYNAEFKNATFKEVGGNPGYMTNMSASDIVLDTPNKPN